MKKLLSSFFLIILCLLLFSACYSSRYEFYEDDHYVRPNKTESTRETDYDNNVSDEPFEMVAVGRSREGNIYYYRDLVTDVLYVSHNGLTPMLDPETGLPLTYTKYMELYENS